MQQASTSFSVLTLRIRNRSPTLRHLYIKRHDATKEPTDQGFDSSLKGRALFVSGLPVGIEEDELRSILDQFGNVDQIVIHSVKTSAIVVFSTTDGCTAVLHAAKSGAVVTCTLQQPAGPFGLKAWVAQHKGVYNRGSQQLSQELDAWLERHERTEQRRKEEQAASLEAEGWTVVQRHKGRKKNVGAGGVRVAGVAQAAAQAAAANKQPQQLDSFYRFQKKDKMRNELLELRQKFEEDRQRIQQLKAERRFKPY